MASLRQELQAIYEQHNTLTAELVVDTARDESHPLHSRFEWDDEVAGHRYRLHQARQLIRTVRVRVIPEEGEPGHSVSVRAYHSVRGPAGTAYRPSQEIVRDPFAARLILADMRREWQALRRRYEEFEEFWRMVNGDLSDRSHEVEPEGNGLSGIAA
jgi:hypothetical protein